MILWSQVLLAGVWGGLLSLERRAFLQAMISRPLVAGATTGVILMDPLSGLYVGVVFELLHLGGASLGGSHPDNETLPTVAAAAWASAVGETHAVPATPEVWALAILLCAPLGPLGRVLETAFDRRAARYLGRAVEATKAGRFRHAARQNLRAMWPHFFVQAALCSAFAALGFVAAPVVDALPPALLKGLGWAYPAMGVVTAAVAIHNIQVQKRLFIAGVSAAFVFALGAFALFSGGAA